jgi:predicted ABC-type ATPase
MTKRLRMFAGPNGSGKSTLQALLPQTARNVFVNADEIEKRWKRHGQLDLNAFQVAAS